MSGTDAQFFQKGKTQELHAELISDKRDAKHTRKRNALKRIVANMTMGNDMLPLFADVVACLQIPMLEVKKMVYLYLIHYARSRPQLAADAISDFLRDLADPNPLIRALALRTMASIQTPQIIDSLQQPLARCLEDSDAYVAKTAALCVAKVWVQDRERIQSSGTLNLLHNLLSHENPNVVANALVALAEIYQRDGSDHLPQLVVEYSAMSKYLVALDEASEWSQAYILESILFVVPQSHADAEQLAERIVPRLQHANSGIVLTTIRVLAYLTHYIEAKEVVSRIYAKMEPPLITLLHSEPEIQFVALKNIQLLIKKQADMFKSLGAKPFFCKYSDPIYVKLAKLEIIFHLTDDYNVEQVLTEVEEYANEVDVGFARRSLRTLGRIAIKIELATDRCVAALRRLIETQVNYIVQEAIVVIRDIFRKYPNRYEGMIAVLCDNLAGLDEPEARAAMIWIIGQYAERIDNASDLLNQFAATFLESAAEVQLALLTATVKLFIKRPSAGQALLPRILKHCTEDVDNPDIRDRGFIYWRLLSTDPVAAKAIVLSQKPVMNVEGESMEPALLEDLILHIATLSSLSQKPPKGIYGTYRPIQIQNSPAFIYHGVPPSTVALPASPTAAPATAAQPPATNPYHVDAGVVTAEGGPASRMLEDDLMQLFGPDEPEAEDAGRSEDVLNTSSGLNADGGYSRYYSHLDAGGSAAGGSGAASALKPFTPLAGSDGPVNPFALSGMARGSVESTGAQSGTMLLSAGGSPAMVGRGGAGAGPATGGAAVTPPSYANARIGQFPSHASSPSSSSASPHPAGVGMGLGMAPHVTGWTPTMQANPQAMSQSPMSSPPGRLTASPGLGMGPSGTGSLGGLTPNALVDPFAARSNDRLAELRGGPTSPRQRPVSAMPLAATPPPTSAASGSLGLSMSPDHPTAAMQRLSLMPDAQRSVALENSDDPPVFATPPLLVPVTGTNHGIALAVGYARTRSGQRRLRLLIKNVGGGTLSGFGLLLNTNVLALAPASRAPLALPPLAPQASGAVVVALHDGAAPGAETAAADVGPPAALHHVQAALRTSAGVAYAPLAIPLWLHWSAHGTPDATAWLAAWTGPVGVLCAEVLAVPALPSAPLASATGSGASEAALPLAWTRDVQAIEARLIACGCHVVAQRRVEPLQLFFMATRLASYRPEVFLSEVTVNALTGATQITTRTAAPHWIPAYHEAMLAVMTTPGVI